MRCSIKFLHRCCSINAILSTFLDISDACVFCKGATDFIEQFFLYCAFSCFFFLDLKRRFGKGIPLKGQYVLYIFNQLFFMVK
ncbi:hypothetical protein MHYP_G00029670 [Metynnis hypsauchen]